MLKLLLGSKKPRTPLDWIMDGVILIGVVALAWHNGWVPPQWALP